VLPLAGATVLNWLDLNQLKPISAVNLRSSTSDREFNRFYELEGARFNRLSCHSITRGGMTLPVAFAKDSFA
jgi:hypothetical protein